jgi:3-oxoacyl-[acyl-carrier-protein] synthase-1
MQIAAIKTALERSNLKNADYASLHATGTLANDEMEALALRATMPDTPASGLKGALGHTLGAAGAIEMGVCHMAISRGVIPPHVAHGEMIEGANLCLEAKPASVNSAINLSFAFGGDNVASVIGRR